jgi:sugar phosphate isomerase/epimerase
MKLCFSTLGCVEKTLSESLSLARSHGMDAIEIRGVGGILPNGEIADFSEENATKTKSLFAEYGVAPYVLGTSCAFHTEEKYEKAMVEGREAILIARRIGFPFIRVFGNNILPDAREESIARVCDGIAALCDFAKDKNVTVLLEVHADFNTVDALAPVLKALGTHENFGLIWDVMHSHVGCGLDWLPFYECIRPYIRHVHLKDIAADGTLVATGDGEIPLIPIIDRLLSDGYDGYFSLEWERKWKAYLAPIEEALVRYLDLVDRRTVR